MKVLFKLLWSDHVKERSFSFPRWSHPLPRKGESVLLYATYTGERKGLKLIPKEELILCHFRVERVSYQEDADHVDINLSFLVPALQD
jgi:hypothetical protein